MRAIWGVACLALLLTKEALGFVGPVTLDPRVLVEGQQGFVHVTMGACDFLGPTEIDGAQVLINGTSVLVTVTGHHELFEDFCLWPTGDYKYSFGPVAPGQYVVHLFRRELDEPFPIDELGSANLTVISSTSVPALETPAEALLLVLVAFLAAVKLFQRSRSATVVIAPRSNGHVDTHRRV